MTSDSRQDARAALAARIAEISNDPPSLVAIYSLEELFAYDDFWQTARDLLIERWKALGDAAEDAWRTELRQPLPDLRLWFPISDRRSHWTADMREADTAWLSRPPDRFFAHSRRIGPPSDVAALHLELLAHFDQLAAIEYVASIPHEAAVRSAELVLRLGERGDLVERAAAQSDRDAALLALSSLLEGMRAAAEQARSATRWETSDVERQRAEDAEAELWRVELPTRLGQLSALIVGRTDGGAVLSPWIRQLVRLKDRVTFRPDDPMPRVAALALETTYEGLANAANPVAYVKYPVADAPCVIAQVLVREASGNIDPTLWTEWRSLLLSEHASLRDCDTFAWEQAAQALVRTDAPLETWLETARKLSAVLRRMERGPLEGEVDVVVHLVVPAIHASAVLRDERLWWAAFALARRHVLVHGPTHATLGYQLPSVMFSAFPKIFSSNGPQLEAALEMLPTPEHRAWAEKALARNSASSLAAGSDRST